jgi:hypothetical protein
MRDGNFYGCLSRSRNKRPPNKTTQRAATATTKTDSKKENKIGIKSKKLLINHIKTSVITVENGVGEITP